MSPENKLAVVPAADYTVEFRAYKDDAWYSVAVFLEGETLRIKYLNFPDEHDNLFEPTGFQTLKHLDEFKERFRPLSKQLQDNECRQLVRDVKVCACHHFSDDDVRFYDAVVDGNFLAYVENQFHTNIKILRTDSGGEYISHAFQEYDRNAADAADVHSPARVLRVYYRKKRRNDVIMSSLSMWKEFYKDI